MNNKIKIFLLIILILEIIYLSFKHGKDYYDYVTEKNEIEQKNEILKKDIKILTNMKAESTSSSVTDKVLIERKFLNKEFISGIKINKVEIIEKISKKGVAETFFTVKLYPNSKNRDLIKRLVILLMLNPEVYKISDVNIDFIEIIMEINYGWFK